MPKVSGEYGVNKLTEWVWLKDNIKQSKRMDNKEFGKQLENRTKKFAVGKIKLSTLKWSEKKKLESLLKESNEL